VGEGVTLFICPKVAGLEIDWEDPGFTLSKLRGLTQTPREFDFENSHWPSQFHHTGPFPESRFATVTSAIPSTSAISFTFDAPSYPPNRRLKPL
jgi:hypothetical protein